MEAFASFHIRGGLLTFPQTLQNLFDQLFFQSEADADKFFEVGLPGRYYALLLRLDQNTEDPHYFSPGPHGGGDRYFTVQLMQDIDQPDLKQVGKRGSIADNDHN